MSILNQNNIHKDNSVYHFPNFSSNKTSYIFDEKAATLNEIYIKKKKGQTFQVSRETERTHAQSNPTFVIKKINKKYSSTLIKILEITFLFVQIQICFQASFSPY